MGRPPICEPISAGILVSDHSCATGSFVGKGSLALMNFSDTFALILERSDFNAMSVEKGLCAATISASTLKFIVKMVDPIMECLRLALTSHVKMMSLVCALQTPRAAAPHRVIPAATLNCQ